MNNGSSALGEKDWQEKQKYWDKPVASATVTLQPDLGSKPGSLDYIDLC
jgi:hypothetical protein